MELLAVVMVQPIAPTASGPRVTTVATAGALIVSGRRGEVTVRPIAPTASGLRVTTVATAGELIVSGRRGGAMAPLAEPIASEPFAAIDPVVMWLESGGTTILGSTNLYK